MNANLYELKTKFNENTQGNRGRWLLAGLVVLVALMAYAQVHNALGSKLLALTNTAASVQPVQALPVIGAPAQSSPITLHQRTYMPSAQQQVAVPPSTNALALPHYAPSARHGAACNELPAGTPGCQGAAVSAPSGNSANAVTCAPVSKAAQHWDQAYVSPC